MLTAIAQQPKNVEIGKLAPAKVSLSQPQQAMVSKIRKAGGALTGEDLAADGDKRVLNALEKKGVVSKEGRGKNASWSLLDITVEAKEDDAEVAVTAEDFREICEDILGYGYQSRLARLLGVNKATAGKWMQGILPVPQYAISFIATLQHLQDNQIPLPDFVTA